MSAIFQSYFLRFNPLPWRRQSIPSWHSVWTLLKITTRLTLVSRCILLFSVSLGHLRIFSASDFVFDLDAKECCVAHDTALTATWFTARAWGHYSLKWHTSAVLVINRPLKDYLLAGNDKCAVPFANQTPKHCIALPDFSCCPLLQFDLPFCTVCLYKLVCPFVSVRS